MSGDIIVIGKRINDRFWGYGLNESGYRSGAFHEHPQLSPEGGGGGIEWQNFYEAHYVLCGTPHDAARSIADKIMTTDDSGSPNNWREHEYGAVIARNAAGNYGAFNNRVHTSRSPTNVNVGARPNDPANIAGIIHSHPNRASDYDNRAGRYPSDDDFDRFAQLISDGVFSQNASLFILDAYGSLREFPAATLSQFASMTEDQKAAGEQIPDQITSGGTCETLPE